MKVLILVEGQTEEAFVKQVLAPAFEGRGIFFVPKILETSRRRDSKPFKGGVTGFAKFENDLFRLFADSSAALITTFVDYYALPKDFPGMESSSSAGLPRARVEHVEQALRARFAYEGRFVPFVMLHEFEALLFSDPAALALVTLNPASELALRHVAESVSCPEDIDEGPDTAPSKRIEKLIPTYRKTLHGPQAAARVGLPRLRASCPHFADWLSSLEARLGCP